MGFEYEEDLKIDKFSLDAECIDQPRKFMKWASLLADAMKERDETKQSLNLIRTEISLKARSNPSMFGIDKVTEASIQAAVDSDGNVTKTSDRLIQTQYNVNVLGAAKEAMEQRRSMLENLIKLFLSGYWAEPRVPKQDQEDLTAVGTKEQKQELKKRMNK